MERHKKPKRKRFLTGYFDEFEDLEEKADEGESYIDRVIYMIEAPKLLEKAWKMPWGWDKKEDYARNWFYIPHLFCEYECVELLESNKAEMTWHLRNKTYCPKDWRDFK